MGSVVRGIYVNVVPRWVFGVTSPREGYLVGVIGYY